MKFNDCEVCVELWGAYAGALQKHLRIGSKHQIAAFWRDSDALVELDGLLKQSEQERDAARSAIRTHEKEVHAARLALTA